MAKIEKDEILDHNYDGIQEYDNDLPTWWVAIFWVCVIFSVIYVGYYHIGSGRFTSQKIDERMAEINKLRAADVPAAGAQGVTAQDLLKVVADNAALGRGKTAFETKCSPCHLQQGQGLIGPNLTDDYWIHGGKITDIRKVIVDGVPDKGMIAWGPTMSPSEINDVVAYVWTLHGTNPPNPKEQQGTLSPRE